MKTGMEQHMFTIQPNQTYQHRPSCSFTQHHCMKRLTQLLTLLAIVCTTIFAMPASGQDATEIQPNWIAQGLSADMLELPTVGLSMHMPAGCTYVLKPGSERRMEAAATDLSWHAAIDIRKTADDTLTPTDIANETIQTMVTSVMNASVRSRASLHIGDLVAEQIVIKKRSRPGQPDMVVSYTIFKPMPNIFVVYNVWCPAEHAETVLTLHKPAIYSIRYTDPAAYAIQRDEMIAPVNRILDNLDEKDYRKLIIPEQWYRVYTKDNNDQTHELAYYRVRESISPKSAIGGSITSNEMGLLVRLDSRYLIQPDGSEYFDIQSTSWMSLDRSEEQWSIRSARFVKRNATSYHAASHSTITGTRSGAKIDVVIDIPPASAQVIEVRQPTKSYINQAEQQLIFRLLKSLGDGSYGMYIFEPVKGRIVFRTETVTKEESGTGWRSVSLRAKDVMPNQITFDNNGIVRRSVTSTGQVTVPTTLKEIHKLWKTAKLPTGAGGR